MDDLSGLTRGLGADAPGADPAAAASGLAGALQAEGGLDALIGKLREAGLGDQVDSWIAGGPNQPIDPQQLEGALGAADMERMQAVSGLDIGSLLPLLAAFLPQIINMLTPGGKEPEAGLDAAVSGSGMPDLGGLLGGLMGGGAGGASAGGGGLGDLMGGLGGLLGGDKDR